ncbi:hypothetical protein [Hyphomicrobium sp. DY-1]|uniref:hypothetical protein n=1 Tax=Hyphomicrobium sp. DY-1 TaxID=3075650 RepID=UPI0039C15593
MRPRETTTITWRDVTCQVDHIPDWKIDGWSKLMIRVVHPRGAPLPFCEDGYHVHELDEDDLKAAGGAVAFVLSWLDRDADHPRYTQALYKWRQGDLFR